ncbi:hypothetical protein AYI69_g4239 [Smittium culicis]|uniref:Calcium permeable stress-gated cation channel 1 n=2 Tax=Smittium culicis TaxID=133412 RepID=A0A1R1YF89_9FUNG|nr:hypothetical protein AYI69_g4239 [Smittium culicis]
MAANDAINSIFTDKAQLAKQTLDIISLLYQAGVFLLIGIAIFGLFNMLRPNNSAVYARKFKEVSSRDPSLSSAPPKLSKNIFTWIKQFYFISKEKQLQVIGLDGYLFLRFIRLCTIQLSIMSFFGIAVILPINYFNGNNTFVSGDPNKFLLLYLTLYHITSIKIYWVHVCFAYLYTFIFIYLIYLELRNYISLKLDYFSSPNFQTSISSRSLLLQNVPKPLQSEPAISHFLANLLPETPPDNANFVRLMGDLPKLVDEHEKTVRKLERVLQNYLLKPDAQNNTNRPTIKLKNGSSVDSIDHYTKQLNNLEIAISVAREKISAFTSTNIGFVSYQNPSMAFKAHDYLKKISKSDKKDIKFALAPDPNDIIWNNVFITKESRTLRLWISRSITFAFCLLSFIPSSALIFILDVTNIQDFFPNTTSFFTNNIVITRIWQYCILPLVLVIYYYYIPMFFRFISNYQGTKTSTAIERAVCKKMYLFYMITNVFVFTITSLIFSLAEKGSDAGQLITNYPSRIINEVNTKNQFWTAYVLLKALTSVIEILQIIPLVTIFFKRYSRFLTPRELKDLISAPVFDIAPSYALYLWIFTICMIYCVYAPITLPFGLACFLIAGFVFKYNLLYVYKNQFETQGRMFKIAVNRLLFALLLFQLYIWYGLRVRLGEFSAPRTASNAVAPLPFISIFSIIALSMWSAKKSRYPVGTIPILPPVQSPDSNNNFSSAIKRNNLGDSYLHPVLIKELTAPIVMRKLEPLLSKVYSGKIGTLNSVNKYNGLSVLPYSNDYSESINSSSYELPNLSQNDQNAPQSMMKSELNYNCSSGNGSDVNLISNSPQYSITKEDNNQNSPQHLFDNQEKHSNAAADFYGDDMNNSNTFGYPPSQSPEPVRLQDYSVNPYRANQNVSYSSERGGLSNSNGYYGSNNLGSQGSISSPQARQYHLNQNSPIDYYDEDPNSFHSYNTSSNRHNRHPGPQNQYLSHTEVSEMYEPRDNTIDQEMSHQTYHLGSDPRMNYNEYSPQPNYDSYQHLNNNFSDAHVVRGYDETYRRSSADRRNNTGGYPGDNFSNLHVYPNNTGNGSDPKKPKKLNRK